MTENYVERIYKALYGRSLRTIFLFLFFMFTFMAFLCFNTLVIAYTFIHPSIYLYTPLYTRVYLHLYSHSRPIIVRYICDARVTSYSPRVSQQWKKELGYCCGMTSGRGLISCLDSAIVLVFKVFANKETHALICLHLLREFVVIILLLKKIYKSKVILFFI